ncbi:hypothetical protein [Acidovorax sp.]|uniref:hypothetical protein n=1 Tax=Acidovorax sp. TaxID=1872122 RepID=UPI00262351AC|nr:hypothetical protein [Acidovorax sp.]
MNMKLIQCCRAFCIAWVLSLPVHAVWAGEGHDHGEAPAAQAGTASPRFAATSDLFELVGVLNGQTLSLYLDRADDNSPAKGATLDLVVDAAPVAVQTVGDGEFEAMLPNPVPEGVLAVTATVVAGNDSDLLAGELDIHASVHAPEAAGRVSRTTQAAAVVAAIGIVLALLAMLRARRARTARTAPVGGAA